MATDKSPSVLHSFTDYILGLMVCVFDGNHGTEDERKQMHAEWMWKKKKQNNEMLRKMLRKNKEDDEYMPPPAYSPQDNPIIIPKIEPMHYSTDSEGKVPY
eukprot:119325_1